MNTAAWFMMAMKPTRAIPCQKYVNSLQHPNDAL